MFFKKLILGVIAVAGLSSCSTDPAKYDLKSPCVSNSSEIFLDAPCERRLPLENERALGIIANS